jgi:hypothetical protein
MPWSHRHWLGYPYIRRVTFMNFPNV